jgi:hypothetical protein
MTLEIETVDKHKERHVTTIAGPQAEEILKAINSGHMHS